MKILLCGQKRFGRETFNLLQRLGHEIVAVVCPTGGGDKLEIAALNLGIPVISSGQLSAETCPEGLDLIMAAHSHNFIGRRTRQKALLGALGYHPSLLPLHRGRDAVRWAIRMNERVTGGTAYWLNDAVDAGPIAAQDWCFIRPEDDPRTLWDRELLPMGLRLFEHVLSDLQEKRWIRIEQDEALATWEPSMQGQPRLFRPDLLQIGSNGFAVQKTRYD
jgi:methionyl-tRNA formyltransferase